MQISVRFWLLVIVFGVIGDGVWVIGFFAHGPLPIAALPRPIAEF